MARMEHFALYAADTPALKDFYVEALGLRVIFENGKTPPAYFLADDHGMAIEIIARPTDQSNPDQRWVCHVAFWVDDFGKALDALKARGIAFEADTFVDTPAMRTAFFNDPEGNRLQIVWRNPPLAV